MDVKIGVQISRPTAIKFHPRLDEYLAIGYDNGTVVFLNQRNEQTYFLKASSELSKVDDSSSSSSYSSDEERAPTSAVSELQWDPNEENILVSFTDASICLVSFAGLDAKTCVK